MTRNISLALISLLSISLVAQPSLSYAADSPAVTSDHSIHDGTPVKLRLRENVSSGTARTGQEVPFETVDEIQVDGVTVLPKGSTTGGTIHLTAELERGRYPRIASTPGAGCSNAEQMASPPCRNRLFLARRHTLLSSNHPAHSARADRKIPTLSCHQPELIAFGRVGKSEALHRSSRFLAVLAFKKDIDIAFYTG